MNRIDKKFLGLAKNSQKALIPYVCCGDPNLNFTEKLIFRLAENGADLIELGIPYSDPIADGPVIQRAADRALKDGVTLVKVLNMVERLRDKIKTPLIIMTYFNPVYVMGMEDFIDKASSAGVDGLIIPDLPIEEAGEMKRITDKKNVRLILLAAPTSDSKRIERIANLSGGFIYCVSIAGVTGARNSIAAGLEDFLDSIRNYTSLPLCVGFGISNEKTAQEAAKYADGVIVGSALIKIIEEELIKNCDNYENALRKAGSFIKGLNNSIK